ncbi:MAG: Maf family protein [Xanthomonadales bacterium]|nr:Maf family protein [Xanthomonadales bacterium]
MPAYPLFLASRSPRRRQLLEQLGLRFGVLELEVPERQQPGERAEDYVRRVARDKALLGRQRCGEQAALVIGGDTEVVLDGAVLGKPEDAGEARRMLRALAGRSHRVLSAVCVAGPRGLREALSETAVWFAPLDDDRIERYLATGEWRGRAGGYAIQGFAASFIARIEGSYSGVMGLPLYETAMLLEQADLPVAVDIPAPSD